MGDAGRSNTLAVFDGASAVLVVRYEAYVIEGKKREEDGRGKQGGITFRKNTNSKTVQERRREATIGYVGEHPLCC